MSILVKNVMLNNKETDIFIQENKITKIGKNLNEKAEYKINGKHKAAIPSLINSHTHAAMALMRGYADDMKVIEWLQEKIWPLEAKMTEDDIYWGSKLACLEMIKTGTTFFNDMYWHYHGTAKAVEEMGIRAAVSAVFIDLFDKAKAQEQIKLNEKLFRETRRYSDRVIFALGPHAIYTVSEESLKWIKEFADKHNLLIHIHLSESEQEVNDCIKKHGIRPVEYLNKIGFLGRNVIAAHCVWLNRNEIAILKNKGVKIAHNPTSNMKLASGNFQYTEIHQDGVPIGIGTDGCASNNNLDMFEEMKMASLFEKVTTKMPTAFPAREVFDSATRTGANMFNLNCGEIKEGKLADLLLINLRDINLVPNHNLISNIVYAANGSCVDATICNGKILMQNRKVEGEEKIIEKAQKVAFDLVKR